MGSPSPQEMSAYCFGNELYLCSVYTPQPGFHGGDLACETEHVRNRVNCATVSAQEEGGVAISTVLI